MHCNLCASVSKEARCRSHDGKSVSCSPDGASYEGKLENARATLTKPLFPILRELVSTFGLPHVQQRQHQRLDEIYHSTHQARATDIEQHYRTAHHPDGTKPHNTPRWRITSPPSSARNKTRSTAPSTTRSAPADTATAARANM